jgi:FkbM family methyltransferase
MLTALLDNSRILRMRDRIPERPRHVLDTLVVASDVQTVNRLLRWKRAAGPDPVPLRLRITGGRPVFVRPASGDRWAVLDLHFPPSHLPPDGAVTSPRTILVLGANIGLTMLHLGIRYPGARIVGVELNPDNAALCRRNIAALGGRATLVEGAVWHESGTVAFDPTADSLSFSARAVAETEGPVARALGIAELLAEQGIDGPVDYVKMDIEGAERTVLAHGTGWAERVRCISVEVHPPYTVGDCVRDLRALGFTTSVADAFSGMRPVIGVRAEAR